MSDDAKRVPHILYFLGGAFYFISCCPYSILKGLKHVEVAVLISVLSVRPCLACPNTIELISLYPGFFFFGLSCYLGGAGLAYIILLVPCYELIFSTSLCDNRIGSATFLIG